MRLFVWECKMKFLKIGLFALYCCVITCIIENISWNGMLVVIILLPICLVVTIAVHELSHFICFVLLGFKVKNLRIGLFLFDFRKGAKKIFIMNSGMFRGFCTIEGFTFQDKKKLFIAIVAGGMSGLILSFIALWILELKSMPEQWNTFFISIFFTGLYSFYATLLSSRSTDGKLIRKIIREEIKNDNFR